MHLLAIYVIHIQLSKMSEPLAPKMAEPLALSRTAWQATQFV